MRFAIREGGRNHRCAVLSPRSWLEARFESVWGVAPMLTPRQNQPFTGPMPLETFAS